MSKISFLLFLALFSFFNSAEGADLKRIVRALEKQDYAKVFELLDENIQEDSINPGSRLIYAQLLSNDSLGFYDLDRAQRFIVRALSDYEISLEETHKDLLKYGYEFNVFEKVYEDIKSAVFIRAIKANSISGYEDFLKLYPESNESMRAIIVRDSLAYDSVDVINTWEAHVLYQEAYPDSKFISKSKERYEILLYQDKTSSNKLADYIDFAMEYPGSPFINEVHRFIFERSTVTNLPEDFVSFIRTYPNAKEVDQALQILFHLDKRQFIDNYLLMAQQLADSISEIYILDTTSVLSIQIPSGVGLVRLRDGGLMGSYNTRIDKSLFCGIYDSDILYVQQQTKSGLVNRKGHFILNGIIRNWSDLGVGHVWVDKGDSVGIWHKSGRFVMPAKNAEVIGDRWLKVGPEKEKSLYSFTAQKLTSITYENIWKDRRFWFISQDNLMSVYSQREFEQALFSKEGFKKSFEYEDVEFLNDSLLIGFRGDLECVFNANGEYVIPWDEHAVYPHRNLPYAKQGKNYKVYDESLTPVLGGDVFENILVNDYWVGVRAKQWIVLDEGREIIYDQVDSLVLLNDQTLLVQKGDSLFARFVSGRTMKVETGDLVSTISFRTATGLISSNFVVRTKGKVKTVWDTGGMKVIEGEFTEISLLTDSLFRVTIGGKQGVIGVNNSYLIEPKNEFVQYGEGIIKLLNRGKITGFDLVRKVKIPGTISTGFSKVGVFYRMDSNDKIGLLDSSFQEVLPPVYNSIDRFTNTLFMVTDDSSKLLISSHDRRTVFSDVLAHDLLYEDEQGNSFFRIVTRNGAALVSSDGRLLTSAHYQDIYPITTTGLPVFMCVQLLEEAGYYLNVVFKSDGSRLYSQAVRSNEYVISDCTDE